MNKTELWAAIHAERKALVADLGGVAERDWGSETLCRGWSVTDLVAHMVATARLAPAKFFPRLIGSGFSLTRMQAKDIAATRGASPSESLASLESVADSTGGPPGPPQTMLGETFVHAEDIRRPLGIVHDYPTDALAAIAEFYGGSNLIIGGKRRVAGLALNATDVNWTHGSGPEVRGPLLSLVMATAGRGAAYKDSLEGPGLSDLLQRS